MRSNTISTTCQKHPNPSLSDIRTSKKKPLGQLHFLIVLCIGWWLWSPNPRNAVSETRLCLMLFTALARTCTICWNHCRSRSVHWKTNGFPIRTFVHNGQCKWWPAHLTFFYQQQQNDSTTRRRNRSTSRRKPNGHPPTKTHSATFVRRTAQKPFIRTTPQFSFTSPTYFVPASDSCSSCSTKCSLWTAPCRYNIK